MKPTTLLRLTIAGLLTGAATHAFAFDQLIGFSQTLDTGLFNYLINPNPNSSLGFNATGGVGGLGGGVFQSTGAAGDTKNVIAILPTTIDSTLTQEYDASFTIKYSQLATQPAATDYSTTVHIGFASDNTLGTGIAANKFFSNTPSFQMSVKFEHDLTKTQAAYMGLDMSGNAGTSPLAATRQKDLNFDGDTWYRFELKVVRDSSVANGYDFSAMAFDLGTDGLQTPLLVLTQTVLTIPDVPFSTDSSIYSVFEWDGETTSAGPASMTMVDNVTFHTEALPEPTSTLLLGFGGCLLGRRRRRALV